MRLIRFFAVSVLISLALLLPAAAAHTVSSTELIENAAKYDGQRVTYCGEAVGDILRRGSHAWVNLSDGANSIGVYLPYSQVRKIQHLGKYRVTGDTVILTGTFHRACAEHGGDLDIHASDIRIVKPGNFQKDPLTAKLAIAAGSLSVCALAAVIFTFRRRV